MTTFQANPKLLSGLRAAAGRKMSACQVRAQRVSFVMSTVDTNDQFTRADVEKVIDEREGTAA